MRTEIVLTFPDTRNAIGGEKALLDAGVAVRVMSRPLALGQGCGICLRVDAGDRVRATEVLREAGIEVEAHYQKECCDGGSLYRRL